MHDKTYTFTEGADTFHVSVDRSEIAQARTRVTMIYSVFITLSLVLGIGFPPLLVIPIILGLMLAGRLASLDDEAKRAAKAEADRQFRQAESERWRALRAIGS